MSARRSQRAYTATALALAFAAAGSLAACDSNGKSKPASNTVPKEPPVTTTKPPGPPPGPPPPPGQAPPQEVSRFKTYMESIAAPTDDLHEDEALRVGDWRFYFRGPPVARTHQVALNAAGAAVAVKALDHWHAFLSDKALDAAGAHERIAWLYGRAAAVDGSYKFKDPKAAAMVAAPVLDRAADSIEFKGWVLYPPQMQTPFQISVTAPAKGPAVVKTTPWTELP